jgi:hypothetical protein
MWKEFWIESFQEFVERHHFLRISTVWVKWTDNSGGFNSWWGTLFRHFKKYKRVCPSPTHKAFFIDQPLVARTILNTFYFWMFINSCKNDIIIINSFWVRIYLKFKVPIKLPLSGTFFHEITHLVKPIVLICYFWCYITLLEIPLLFVE